MQRIKRGNPHHPPKNRKTKQYAPSPVRQQRAPSAVAQPVEPIEHVRLTLHDIDPIIGNEDTLYTLFYEYYRGYTIYSTAPGRCCIHGKQGCLRLRGMFACFPDIEYAKTLIKRFRADGYTSSDPLERYLPEWEYVCLNSADNNGLPRRRIPCSGYRKRRSERGRLPYFLLSRRKSTRRGRAKETFGEEKQDPDLSVRATPGR